MFWRRKRQDTLHRMPFIPTVRLLFHILWNTDPLFFLCLLLLTVLSGIVTPLQLLLNAALLSLIVGSLSSVHAMPGTVSSLIHLIILTACLQLGGQIVAQLQQTIQTFYQLKVTHSINLLLAKKASQLDLAFFENPTFHNQLSNASNEASFRPLMILNQLLTIVSTTITTVWVVVFLFQWQWWIVVLVTGISALRYWVVTRQGKVHAALVLQQTPLQRTAQYVQSVLTSDLFAKEVRVFHLAPFLLARYRTYLDQLYQQTRQSERRLFIVAVIAQPILLVSRPILLLYAGIQAIQRTISIAQYSIYSQSILQLDTGFQTIMIQIGQFYENMLFFRNLAMFLQLTPDIEKTSLAEDASFLIPATVPTIDFCDVSFHYPDSTTLVLNHLSFHIAPGETVAFVGVNGAGKTTIIKLLTGLYRPTDGQILLNGMDITQLDRGTLRAYLGTIFQDFAIYHWSAADNIGVGNVEAITDRARVEQAAQRSGFASLIEKFPQGYETILGRWIERGQELSGGQRQLLAISRALMKNAPILILDEPGAALDVEREEEMFQRLLSKQRSHDQTVLFSSHRFSTVRHADHILVLEQGKIIEEGSHAELMQQQGRYAYLFTHQARMYTDEYTTSEIPMSKTPVI